MPLEDISFRDYEMIVLYNLLLTQAKFSLEGHKCKLHLKE